MVTAEAVNSIDSNSLYTVKPLLLVDGLVKRYGSITAVSGLSLSVNKGETVVLMGPSGCGKSTTIRCINRLTEPTSGTIYFDGTEISALGERDLCRIRPKIGFVFQNFNLIHRLSALQNVSLGLRAQGVNEDEAKDKALAALDRVGLRNYCDKKPDQLSGGQQQRVGIARAMAMEPTLMLWDEPTASLDPILVREVLDVMEEMILFGNTTMVIVTHELAFAHRVASRLILMDKGSIVEEGSPREIFREPKSQVGMKYKDIIARSNF